MANRKDYTKLRKNYLGKFKIAWSRLPEYLAETNQEVETLQISNTAVGKITAKAEGVNAGTPLIIGRKYYTSGVTPGDDLSNVGWIADDETFIATATTPTVWTDSNINLITEGIIFFYNDIDANMVANYDSFSQTGQIIITNNAFNALKTYPVAEQTKLTIQDDNTIISPNQFDDLYFKIEIYV